MNVEAFRNDMVNMHTDPNFMVDLMGAIQNDDDMLEDLSAVLSHVIPDVTGPILKEALQAMDMDAFCQRVRTDTLTEVETSALSQVISGTPFDYTDNHIDRVGQIVERLEARRRAT